MKLTNFLNFPSQHLPDSVQFVSPTLQILVFDVGKELRICMPVLRSPPFEFVIYKLGFKRQIQNLTIKRVIFIAIQILDDQLSFNICTKGWRKEKFRYRVMNYAYILNNVNCAGTIYLQLKAWELHFGINSNLFPHRLGGSLHQQILVYLSSLAWIHEPWWTRKNFGELVQERIVGVGLQMFCRRYRYGSTVPGVGEDHGNRCY